MRNASGYGDFPGRGVLINALRILHLAGVVAVGSALLGTPAREPGEAALVLLVAPGAIIALLDGWSKPGYAFQLKGLGVMAKLLLMAWMVLDAGHRVALFWTILAVSSALAHAPGRVRGYSPWRSRRQAAATSGSTAPTDSQENARGRASRGDGAGRRSPG